MYKGLPLVIALIIHFLAGCGSSPQEEFASRVAQAMKAPSNDSITESPLGNLQRVSQANSNITDSMSITAEQLFDWAEAALPEYFAKKEKTLEWSNYLFRYYKDTDVYLAVENGTKVVALGKPTGGMILELGPISSFSKQVTELISFTTELIELRAGESMAVPVRPALTQPNRDISRLLTVTSSNDSILKVSDGNLIVAQRYDGFEVKIAIITVSFGSISKSIQVTVLPDSSFSGYRVGSNARREGTKYWKNTPVPLELVLRNFLTRHKNYPEQYSGWSGAVTAGDFNNDGFIDVFTAGSACNGMQSRPTFLIWNPKKYIFEEKNLFNDGTNYLGGPMGIIPIYLNEDNYVDLIIIGHNDECFYPPLPNEPVRVALSDGNGGYDLKILDLQSKELLDRFGQEWGDADDVTGDGIPDLYLTANSHSYIFKGLDSSSLFDNKNYAHFASDTRNFSYAQNGCGEQAPLVSDFAFGGRIADFNGDGLKDIIVLTSEDKIAQRPTRIFYNTGAGCFKSSVVQPLPYFYDYPTPNPNNWFAHLMDIRVFDLNGDGLLDIVGVNQESYQQWNMVVYLRQADGTYRIDQTRIKYGLGSSKRPQYKTYLVQTDFDGDGVDDIGYMSMGTSCSDLINKSVFLQKAGNLVEVPLADLDPYAKWLNSRVREDLWKGGKQCEPI